MARRDQDRYYDDDDDDDDDEEEFAGDNYYGDDDDVFEDSGGKRYHDEPALFDDDVNLDDGDYYERASTDHDEFAEDEVEDVDSGEWHGGTPDDLPPEDFTSNQNHIPDDSEAGRAGFEAQLNANTTFATRTRQQRRMAARKSGDIHNKKNSLYSVPFWGRTEELEMLGKAVERVSLEWMENPAEVAWVSGCSGSGKSTLVKELAERLIESGQLRHDQDETTSMVDSAFVCRGTWEQHNTACVPFKGLTDCLNDLVTVMEERGGAEIWKPRLEEALGGDGPVLSTICPRLPMLMDMPPEEVDVRKQFLLFNSNTQRRLDRLGFAIRDMLATVCDHHPLVLIVDNLQWADPDSLQMIKELLTEKSVQNFLLIGCYQEESLMDTNMYYTTMEDDQETQETDPVHPLLVLQEILSTHTARVTHVKLENLTMPDLSQFLSHILIRPEYEDAPEDQIERNEEIERQIEDLAEFTFGKTKGNILFTVEWLRLWDSKGLIEYDADDDLWEFNVDRIKNNKKLNCERNNSPTALVASHVDQLAPKVRRALTTAAYLGLTYFRVDTLYRMCKVTSGYQKKSKDEIEEELENIDDLTKALNFASRKGIVKRVSKSGYYKFMHDQTRESIFTLLPKKKLGKLMVYRMGSELSKMSVDALKRPEQHEPDERERLKFLSVHQLNISVDDMPDQNQRAKLAKLNMEAAEIATTKSAFRTSVFYLETGISMLATMDGDDGKGKWPADNYDLRVRLHMILARMQYCSGEIYLAQDTCDTILRRATSLKDKIHAHQLLAMILVQENRHKQALNSLLAVADQLGTKIPRRHSSKLVEKELDGIQRILREKSNEQLLGLPRMTDKKSIDTMLVLAQIVEVNRLCSGVVDEEDYENEIRRLEAGHEPDGPTRFQDLAAVRMMNITLRSGFCRVTPLAYALCAEVLVGFGYREEAYRLGRCAEKLTRPGCIYAGVAMACHHQHIAHWRRPYRKSLEPLLKLYNAQVDAGNFDQISTTMTTYIHHHLASGYSLETLEDNLYLFQGIFSDYDLPDQWQVNIPAQMVWSLMGRTVDPLILFGESEEEQGEFVAVWKENNQVQALEQFYFFRMVVACLFNDFQEAGLMHMKLEKGEIKGVWIPYLLFYEGMINLSELRHARGRTKSSLRTRIDDILDQLTEWYNEGAINCDPMLLLLEAEFLVSTGDVALSSIKVRKAFDDAVRAAARGGFLHLEAWANERAGRYFHEAGGGGWTADYFSKAHTAYERWGATAKAIDLETVYGDYLSLDPEKRREARSYRDMNRHPAHTYIRSNDQSDTKGLKGLVYRGKKGVQGISRNSRKVAALFKRKEGEPSSQSKKGRSRSWRRGQRVESNDNEELAEDVVHADDSVRKSKPPRRDEDEGSNSNSKSNRSSFLSFRRGKK